MEWIHWVSRDVWAVGSGIPRRGLWPVDTLQPFCWSPGSETSYPSGLNSHYMRQRQKKKKKKTRMINVPSVWSVSSFSTHTHTCTHTCTHTSWASDVFVLSRKKWMDVYTLHQPQRVFAHRQQRAHGHARSPVATRLYSRGYEKKNVWAQLFSWLTSVVNGGVLT